MAGPDTHPPLPPYLGGWAIASLAFTSPIVLSLILVIMRLILAINSANASVDSAKVKLASSCLGLEQAASVAVSFPHYLADNMNEVTASGAEAIVHGLATVLDMSVLAIEQILVFVVDMYRSMYLCLVELIVRGSMALAIGATREFTDFFNETVAALRNQLQDAVNGANSALDAAVDVINRIPGVDIDSPDLNPNLDFLNNVAIPQSFLQSLVSLNDSLPTLDELKDKMNGVIEQPFEALRAEINTNLGNVTVARDAFPVPEKEGLAFCQDLDYSFVDDVGHTLVKVAQYGIIAIVLFILLYISAMVFVERRWYADLSDYVDRCRASWANDMTSTSQQGYGAYTNTFQRSDMERVIDRPALLGFIGSSHNALLRAWLPRLMDRIPRLKRSPRARSNVTWFVSYITYTPALLLLAVALLGIISIEIQLAALKPTEKTAQRQVNTGLSSFKESIIAQVNNATAEKSQQYANSSNIVLLGVQNGINEDMFGWVESSTTNINTTINEFYTGLTGAISSTFQETVFATAALGVVNCLIGTKIEAVSKALTWLHDNAHVNLPMVSDTVFMLSSDKSDELVSSLDGSNPEDEFASSSLVKTMIGQYKSALEKERVVFFLMLGLYGLVILFGLLAIFWHEIISPKLRKKRTLKASSMKEFYLEKSEQPIRQPSSAHFTTQGAAKVNIVANNVGSRLGSMVASPLARLRQKRSRRREVHSGLSFSAVHPNNAVNDHGDNRAISPPPAYPPRPSTHWTQHSRTLSLLGALNLPNQTESLQSLASVQPASAGVSPNRSSHADALHKSSEQLYKPQEAPSLSVPYLYGTLPAPGVPSPARPPRPATSLNPFVTSFDAPNGQ